MQTTSRLIFADLSHAFAYAMLKRLHVGRLAYSLHDRVDIQPINYVFDDGWIVGRTQVGSKLSTLTHNPWCAFEVDDVRGLFDWDSVVARGSFHILDPEQGSVDRYRRALTVPRPDRICLWAWSARRVWARRWSLPVSGWSATLRSSGNTPWYSSRPHH